MPRQDELTASVESNAARQAHLDRLKADIDSGTYSVPAEVLAAKLLRRSQ